MLCFYGLHQQLNDYRALCGLPPRLTFPIHLAFVGVRSQPCFSKSNSHSLSKVCLDISYTDVV